MLEASPIVGAVSLVETWPPAWPVLAFVAATAAALALHEGAEVGLKRWSGPGASAVRAAIRGPSLLWCIAIGLYAANDVALDATRLPVRWHGRIEMLIEVVVVLSVTVVLVRIGSRAAACVRERSGLGAGVAGFAGFHSARPRRSVGVGSRPCRRR